MPRFAEAARTRDDVVDLVQLWATLRQSYGAVLGVAAAVFLVVMAVTLASRMQFRSVGRLYLGELDDRPRAAGATSASEIDLSVGHGVVASEIEIIRSRSLVMRSVLESGLNVAIAPTRRPPPRYGAWLLSGRDPDLLDAAADELSAQSTVFLDRSRKDRLFRVAFVSDTEYEVWSKDARLAAGNLGRPLSVAGVALTLARGSVRGPMRGAEYDLIVRSPDVVTDRTLSLLQVSAPKVTGANESVNVVTLGFASPSPYLAKTFLDCLMLNYLKERQSWKVEDATAAEAFVSTQLQSMRDALDQIQNKLADYRSKHQMVVLDDEAKAMIEQIGKYEEQRVAARLQVAALGTIHKALKDPNPPIGAYLLGETQDTVLDDMASALSKARDRLIELETRFNDAAPDVRTQRAQVDAQLESIRNYVSSRLAGAQGTLGTLSSIIGQFEEKLKSVPGAELGLVQLSRESEVYNRTYSYLLERQQQAAIVKASTLSKNRVLDAPEVVRDEDSPKLLLRLASGPLGLLLGALVVIVRRIFSGTFQTESDVRRTVGDLPVFATVPWRQRTRSNRRGSQPTDALDPLAGGPNCGFVEAFRTLRANLYRAGLGGAPKVVLVTSPSPSDGKTTCALSLAVMLAADGKRVLVVDADLRNPVQREEDSPEPGLREVLGGECAWRDAVRTVSVSSGEYCWIRSGGAARAELLSSERMTAFLAAARESFDFVVIDSPSFPLVSDAAVLSRSADCVLSVLRLQNGPRKEAVEHVNGLAPFATTYALIFNDVGSPSTYAAAYPAGPKAGKRLPSRKEPSRTSRVGGRGAWWLAGVMAVTLATAAAFIHVR